MGLEFRLSSTSQFCLPIVHPSLLIMHRCPLWGPRSRSLLPFASLHMLPYSSWVAKHWSNNIHLILFALSWFRNHHWPACQEVWENPSCGLEMISEGRVVHVVQAAGTARPRGGMGCIPYFSHFVMSGNLGTQNVSKLHFFFFFFL